MELTDIKMIRHLRARLQQVDRTIRRIDREEPVLKDSVVEILRTLKRELKEVGDIIEALQRLERSKSTQSPNVTTIERRRRRAPD